MNKLLPSIVLLLASCLPGFSQDTPLAAILVEGKGWENAEFKALEAPRNLAPSEHGGYYSATLDNNIKRKPNEILYEHSLGLEKPDFLELPVKKVGAICASTDRFTLVVSDAEGRHLWAFRMEKDGKLTAGNKYYALAVRRGTEKLKVTAMACDPLNRLYAATETGIQIFDPTGRLCGVMTAPTKEEIETIEFIPNAIRVQTSKSAFTRALQLQPPKKK